MESIRLKQEQTQPYPIILNAYKTRIDDCHTFTGKSLGDLFSACGSYLAPAKRPLQAPPWVRLYRLAYLWL